MKDKRDLLDVLKAELEFIQSGGYRKLSWRPQFIFEDSPSCLNYGLLERKYPCSDCALIQLVPAERRNDPIPCRHIPLNKQGETVDSLYRTGTREELETALVNWLKDTIQKLERDRDAGNETKAKAKASG